MGWECQIFYPFLSFLWIFSWGTVSAFVMVCFNSQGGYIPLYYSILFLCFCNFSNGMGLAQPPSTPLTHTKIGYKSLRWKDINSLLNAPAALKNCQDNMFNSHQKSNVIFIAFVLGNIHRTQLNPCTVQMPLHYLN